MNVPLEVQGRRRWHIHRPGRGCLIAALVGLGLLACLVVGRALWLPAVGRFLIVSDPLQHADAIVPLAGERDRVVYAAELFGEGYATWFVATDMPHQVPGIEDSYAQLVRREAVWHGVPDERILTVSATAQTTYQEALAVRQLCQEHGWRTLLVVTSPYHTRRARLAFRDAFRDTGIAIIVHPVSHHWYTPDTWWRSTDGLRDTWTELLKLVLHVVGYR